MVILSGGKVQNIYFDNPESSYFRGIDVTGSAGVQCNYTRNIDVASIIANLTGLPVADVINELNNLSIVDFNSVLNQIANIYINTKNLQYLVEKDIGYIALGLLRSADDNLFWGLVKNIVEFFGRNITFPEDNYYYMLGKTSGDAIFLAGFLQTAGYATIDVGKSLLAAGGFAVGGLILAPTIVGGGVCETAAGAELIEAGVMFIVGCAAGAEAAHSTDLLKSDAGKLSEIKDEAEVTRLTAPEAKKLAESLGFKKVNGSSHGQPVFYNSKLKKYITPDVDSHNGGVWKMANSIEELASKKTRLGTYDANLNRIGD